jgi:hypothetical protein
VVSLVDLEVVLGLTLVVCRTFARRGKSDTPASKVLIEESKSASDSRREETHPSNECAIASMWDALWFVFVSRIRMI